MFFHQLKGELWKLFGKKRTYIGFSMFVLAQLLIILLLRYFPPAHRSLMNNIRRTGFPVEGYISMLTVASLLLMVMAYTLLPLYVALIGGDLVSKEAEEGTLRMILSRPVSRARLICLKWLAGLIFSCLLVLALGASCLFFCAIWFPVHGGLFAQIPDVGVVLADFQNGLTHYVAAHAVMIAKACTIMSLAFMLSCFNMKPAAATILALSLILIDRILMEIPYFQDFKEYFLSYHLNVWQTLFLDPVPWWRVGEALSVMAGASITFLIIGLAAFHARDIKS